MTEQELDQRREGLCQMNMEQLRCGVMLQLHMIDSLTAERDRWKAQHKECTRLLGEALQDTTNMSVERDAYAAAADSMAASHKVERDMLKAALSDWIVANAPGHWIDNLRKERDALKAERDEFNYSLVSTANRKLRSEVDVLRKERDALKDAARLALVFVEHVWSDVSLNEYSEDLRFKIEAALRAAL